MRGHLSRTSGTDVPRDKGTGQPPPLGGVPVSVPCPKVEYPSPAGARLYNLRQAAAYLGLSFWSVRDYVLAGLIPTVNLPPLRAREGERQRTNLRRVLVDRVDLDAFVESRKAVRKPGANLHGRFSQSGPLVGEADE